MGDQGPPPPQPGSFPTPPGAHHASINPPPRATGGPSPSFPQRQERVPAYRPTQPPPQMSVPAPDLPYLQRGTSTTAAATTSTTSTTTTTTGQPVIGAPLPGMVQPAQVDSLAHPPGYQQNTNASEFTSGQRAAHAASISTDRERAPISGDDEDDGVWDSAKKWAQVAGDKLSAAETEVWRRINKD